MKPSESSSLALAHANLINKTLHLEVQQFVMAPRERTVVTLRQKVHVFAQCRRVALLGGVLTAVSRRGVAGVTGIEKCKCEANVQRKSIPQCGCIRTVHFLLSRLYLPRARSALLYLQHGAARKCYQCLPAFAIRVGTLICIGVRVHKYVRVVCGRYRHMGVHVDLCTKQCLLVYKCIDLSMTQTGGQIELKTDMQTNRFTDQCNKHIHAYRQTNTNQHTHVCMYANVYVCMRMGMCKHIHTHD